jgi:serine/threonine-protein kinase RsbW
MTSLQQSAVFKANRLPVAMQTATFPGRYESLQAISDFIKRAAKEAGLDREATYAVELAVDEACSNIIDHAYAGENKGEIECTCTPAPDALTITLRDRGRPFDPTGAPLPKVKGPLYRLKRRGVGVYLIRNMVDELKYEATADRGNLLTLVKKKY